MFRLTGPHRQLRSDRIIIGFPPVMMQGENGDFFDTRNNECSRRCNGKLC